MHDDQIALLTVALAQIRKDSQREFQTEVRVVVPPFQHVSVKPDDLNSTTGVAGDQNGHSGKEVLVDIIVTRSRSPEATCVAIINLAPQRANLTLANPYPRSRFFAAATIDPPAEPGSPPIPQADNGNSLPVRMREYCLDLDAKTYDQNVSFQSDRRDGFRPSNLLADTSMRTLEGTCSLVESFPPSIKLHRKRRPFFVPIIVADEGSFSGESGQNGTTAPNLASQDHAIYDCPVPSGVRFPDYENDVNKPEHETARWPILITKLAGLDDLLDRVYQMPATKKED